MACWAMPFIIPTDLLEATPGGQRGHAAFWAEATRELCSHLRWTCRPAEGEQNGRWGVGYLILRVCVCGTIKLSFMFSW